MKFEKGNRGKPKGAQNKKAIAVKAALAHAFEGSGGVKSLTAWAKANPELFYPLWVKMLVTESKVDFDFKAITNLSDEELDQKCRALRLVS